MSPFILVLFGATGDLVKNKIIPALLELFRKELLPKDFYIVGFSRREMTDEEFREFFSEFSKHSSWSEFSKHLYYQQGLFDEEEKYKDLKKKFEDYDKAQDTSLIKIFYLATPPQNYELILQNIVKANLAKKDPSAKTEAHTRIAIEKPFGKDVETSKELDMKLADIFNENQIFRVDHYLGKETVQNILVFRFANGIFDPVWNKDYIDHVQIVWSETKGLESRGKFFDGVGILRDVGQNHLIQLVAAVAMEMPKTFTKEGVRDVRSDAIRSIEQMDPKKVEENVVRGQYLGYKNEPDINPSSTTETFIATKFFLNSKRFERVPFYVRAGKGLSENIAEIHIVFKQTCHILFKEVGCPEEGNILTIRIQPNEGINVKIIAKVPGPKLTLAPVDMHFNYDESFGTQGIDAYQKVITDVITGDQMLFTRSDEVEASWAFIENILKGWENPDSKLFQYQKGTHGPSAANHLIEKDGRKWVEL